METTVRGIAAPPADLFAAAHSFVAVCCRGVLELWQRPDGFWEAELVHDTRCRVGQPSSPRLLVPSP
jgi:hypothetical protein